MKKYNNTINTILKLGMILVSRLWCSSTLPGSIPEDIQQTPSTLPPRTLTDNTIGASSTGQSYQEYIALAVKLAQEQLQKLEEERLRLESCIQSQRAGQSTSEMLDLESGEVMLQQIEEHRLGLETYIQSQRAGQSLDLELGRVIPPPIPPQPTMIAGLHLMLILLRSTPTSARELSRVLNEFINAQVEGILAIRRSGRGEPPSALAELSDSVTTSNYLEWYLNIKFAFEFVGAMVMAWFFLTHGSF